jgi:hypothetical protein
LYGISSLTYIYLLIEGEVAPQNMYYLYVTSGQFPEEYDRSKAGVYIRPVTATMK